MLYLDFVNYTISFVLKAIIKQFLLLCICDELENILRKKKSILIYQMQTC